MSANCQNATCGGAGAPSSLRTGSGEHFQAGTAPALLRSPGRLHSRVGRRYLLIHPFHAATDGAHIRVRNLNEFMAESLAAEHTEAVLMSVRYAFCRRAVNRPQARIFRRQILLPILWTNRHWMARAFNAVAGCLAGVLLAAWLRPHVVVGENSAAFPLARWVRRFCRAWLIMDLHGAVPEESACLYAGSSRREQIVRQETALEAAMIREAAMVICQSAAMVEHLRRKYPEASVPIHSFPCSVRSDLFRFDAAARERIRAELGMREDEWVFVYAGSLASWQKVENVVQIVRAWPQGGRQARLLILSGDPADRLVAAEPPGPRPRIVVRRVPHLEVPGYLSAADAGFLLREDVTLNRVASPTKLGEYLACGLPVITGAVAAHWPAARQEPGCFCCVDGGDPSADAGQIQDFLQAWSAQGARSRARAIRLAGEVLSAGQERKKLRSVLSQWAGRMDA